MTIADRFQNIFELLGRDLADPRRKFARQNGDVLGISPERLKEIVALHRLVIVDLVIVDQAFGVAVFVQKMERAGEVDAGNVILPMVALMLIEIIAQIENVVRRDNAFARQDVNRVGDCARFGEIRRLAPDHLLQVAQTVRKHFRRRREPGRFRFAQKIHHVGGDKTDPIAGFRDPVTERALIVLAPRQDFEGVFELFVDLRAAQTEVGFIGQHQSAKRAARDLFAATVGKIFQVSIESARESQRHSRHARVQLSKLRMHVARKCDVDLVLETAAANLGHVRRRRSDAQRRATFGLGH